MTFQSSAVRDVTVTLTTTGQDSISFPIPAGTPLTTMPIDSPPITLPLDGDWSISVSG